MSKPMLITFEGIDGSGKTTHIKLVSKYLDDLSIGYRMLREPGGTILSERIRSILLDPALEISPVAELLLFNAARADLVEKVIKPELAAGKIVLCDRFYDSTTAYQGYGRELNIDSVQLCNRAATGGLKPDLTFYLCVPMELSDRRIKRKNADRIENSGTSFYEKVDNGFRQLAIEEPDRFIIVDSTGSIENTHRIIMSFIEKKLAEKKRSRL